MTDEIHTPQTDAAASKRGGRKAGSTAPRGDVAAGDFKRDQSVTAEETVEGSTQTVAPIPFDFQGDGIRTVTEDGEVWFVTADVCAVLGHTDPSSAVSRLDDDQKRLANVRTLGGPQSLSVVSESGLYTLIFTSRKTEAKAFRRWVTGVVLPTIRRTGKFDMRSEHGQGPVSNEIDGASRNGITVALPGPGRYLVVLFHDGERRIQPLSFSDAVSVLAALDCRSIAYTHLTAASLWEKLLHLRSVKGDAGASGGFTFDKLSTTMQAGADLARQILYTYDKPMLIPRTAGEVAAE